MKGLLHPVESHLAKEHEAVLRDYFGGAGEAALERAYELGRRALADDLGVLDVATLHYNALLRVSPPALTPAAWARTIKAAERLLVESLTPFEMTHRGFQEAHAALRASEERYRELVENANDIVFTTDLEGNFTSINRAGERLSGYERHEVLSKNVATVVSPESVQEVRRAREAKLAGKDESTRYELEILTKEGRRVPLEASTRLIHREGIPVGVQGIARDITERKQAEQALRRVNERLEQGIRRIAQALHDEAGQLLAAVYLAVNDVAEQLPLEYRKHLQKISEPLDHAADQLRRLSHELHPVMLDDLGLQPALEFLAQGVSRRTGLVITVDASMEERPASFVETGLYRILQEALTNVSKHAQATYVRVQIRPEGRILSCTVQDDGIGIHPSALRTQRDRPCLGLTGIRERLAALGGTLSIVTAEGEGTTLQMKIPLETRPETVDP
jgi:two-component system sensor histidine kinase UhpB